jgi:deazaflavin-dependent oxidoreductase (nitroreductase family)
MRSKPSGLSRTFFRSPIWLYRIGLGWMLGKRMLHLTHTGRKSGLAREVVLEVVHYWEDSNTYIVAAAWGEKADWYQNVRAAPEVWIKVGRVSSAAIAKSLSVEESERALLEYAADHPTVMRYLSSFMGFESPRNEEDVRQIGRQLPMVGLQPTIGLRPLQSHRDEHSV